MAQNNQTQDHNTADGLPPVDNSIDNAPDPTLEEAARLMSSMDNDSGAPPKPAEPDKKDGIEFLEDPRDAIAKNFRENRSAQAAAPVEQDPDAIDPNSLAAVYGSDAVVADTQAQPEPVVDLNRKIKVKVNGQEQEASLQDIVSNYQKVQAGDAYLRNAKQTADQIINSAKALAPNGAATGADVGRDAHGAPGSSTSDTQDNASTQTRAKFDRDKLAKTVEAISMGSTEEGVSALSELLEAAQPQTPDISTQVEVALANRELTLKSVDATESFLKKYPSLASDDILKDVTGNLMSQEMKKDFENAGLSSEEIAKMAPDRASLKRVHDMARLHNPQFGRPLDKLFSAVEASTHFVKLVGGAQNASKIDVNVDRGARKVLLQPQPALRTPPAPPSSGQQQSISRQAGLSRGFDQIAASRANRTSA